MRWNKTRVDDDDVVSLRVVWVLPVVTADARLSKEEMPITLKLKASRPLDIVSQDSLPE